MSEFIELINKLAELSKGYEFNDGDAIKNLGKFEGEGIATLYFYDCYLNGGGTVMEVTEEERRVLDIDHPWVYLAEDNNGFVSLEFYDTQEAAEARDSEDTEEDEPEDEPEEEHEPVYCLICGGEGGLMGGLGKLTYYRCIQCGWQFAV